MTKNHYTDLTMWPILKDQIAETVTTVRQAYVVRISNIMIYNWIKSHRNRLKKSV